MNDCIGFAELVSAYADGELRDSDLRRVEAHLETCESCSALLELYREISAGMEESCVPAPESLSLGVMEKILSGDVASTQAVEKILSDGAVFVQATEKTLSGDLAPMQATEKTLVGNSVPAQISTRKRKPAHIFMLRYAPVAACLALILIALPWIIDKVGPTHTKQDSFNTSSITSETAQFAPQLKIADDNDSLPSLNGGADAGAFGAAFDEAATGGAMQEDSIDSEESGVFMDRYATDENEYTLKEPVKDVASGDDGKRLTESDAKESPAQAPAPAPAPAPASGSEPETVSTPVPDSAPASLPAPDSPSDPGRESVYGETMDAAPGGQGSPPPQINSEIPEDVADCQAPEPEDVFSLLDEFGDAYAWIEVKGELPNLLKSFVPEPVESWLDWECYYKIPQKEAKELIAELKGSEGTSVTVNNKDGAYAIVLYKQ